MSLRPTDDMNSVHHQKYCNISWLCYRRAQRLSAKEHNENKAIWLIRALVQKSSTSLWSPLWKSCLFCKRASPLFAKELNESRAILLIRALVQKRSTSLWSLFRRIFDCATKTTATDQVLLQQSSTQMGLTFKTSWCVFDILVVLGRIVKSVRRRDMFAMSVELICRQETRF